MHTSYPIPCTSITNRKCKLRLRKPPPPSTSYSTRVSVGKNKCLKESTIRVRHVEKYQAQAHTRNSMLYSFVPHAHHPQIYTLPMIYVKTLSTHLTSTCELIQKTCVHGAWLFAGLVGVRCKEAKYVECRWNTDNFILMLSNEGIAVSQARTTVSFYPLNTHLTYKIINFLEFRRLRDSCGWPPCLIAN